MSVRLSDLGKIVAQAIKSKETLKVGAEIATTSIVKRTRLGNGVRRNLGETHKLPTLGAKTVENRKRLKGSGGLTGQGATPAKSAINRTGETLNSVSYKLRNDGIDIELNNANAKEKAKDLIRINEGYTFMNLSKAEFNRVTKAIKEAIDKVLNGINITKL